MMSEPARQTPLTEATDISPSEISAVEDAEILDSNEKTFEIKSFFSTEKTFSTEPNIHASTDEDQLRYKLPVDIIKNINRTTTRKIHRDVIENFFEEHENLVKKKFESELSKKEERRLSYIRWQIDRINDAFGGTEIEYLGKMVENYEKFANDLNRLLESL